MNIAVVLIVIIIKNKEKIIFQSIYLCIWIFFCNFAAAISVHIGARRYAYGKERKNISSISCISRRENGVGISPQEC